MGRAPGALGDVVGVVQLGLLVDGGGGELQPGVLIEDVGEREVTRPAQRGRRQTGVHRGAPDTNSPYGHLVVCRACGVGGEPGQHHRDGLAPARPAGEPGEEHTGGAKGLSLVQEGEKDPVHSALGVRCAQHLPQARTVEPGHQHRVRPTVAEPAACGTPCPVQCQERVGVGGAPGRVAAVQLGEAEPDDGEGLVVRLVPQELLQYRRQPLR